MSQLLLEDDISLIYQQLQDIAESLINPSPSPSISSPLPSSSLTPHPSSSHPPDECLDQIESLCNEIERKERQIHRLVEIALSMVEKTKSKIEEKNFELDFLRKSIKNHHSELEKNKILREELLDLSSSLAHQKISLERFLSDLEVSCIQNQDILLRSEEEFKSLEECQTKYNELLRRKEPNSELLAFYQNLNERLKGEMKGLREEIGKHEGEVREGKEKLGALVEKYEDTSNKVASAEQKRAKLQEQVIEIKAQIIALQDKNSILTNEIKFEQKKRTANIPRLIKEKESFILKGERRSEDLHSSSLISIELYTEEFRERMGDEEKEHLRGLCFGGNGRRGEEEEEREGEGSIYKKEDKKAKDVGDEEGDEEVEELQEDKRENEDVGGQEEEGRKEGNGDEEGGKEEKGEKKEGRKKKRKKKKSGLGIFSFLVNKEYVLTGLLLLIPLYFLTNPKHY